MAQAPGNGHSSIGSATDTRRGFLQFLRLPPLEWLSEDAIVVLALMGTAAFAVTGFSGDRFSPSWLSGDVFSYPVFLFAWLLFLLARLQWLMLSDPLPGSGLVTTPARRGAALGATGVIVAIVLVIPIVVVIPSPLSFILHQVTSQLGDSRLRLILYVIHIWIIGWLLVLGAKGTLTWLFRRVRHEAVAGMARKVGEGFFAVAILFGVLALLSELRVLSILANLFQSSTSSHRPLDSCVAFVFPSCDQRPLGDQIRTWTDLDSLVALICFAACLFTLGLSLFRRGNTSGIIGEANELGSFAKDTLAWPFRLVRELIYTLRHVLWPTLIFLAVLGEAFAAFSIQEYLHFLSARHEAGQGFQVHLEHYGYLPAALACAVLPVLFMAMAVSLYLWRSPVSSLRQMSKYWLLGFFRLGMVALLPFAVISLGLSICNLIWAHFAPPAPLPFWPPGLSTVVPIGLYVVIVVVIRLRERRTSSSRI